MKKRFRYVKLRDGEYAHEVLRSSQLLLEDLNTPVSLSVFLLIKYNEWNQIADKEINPLDYNSSDNFRKDYQAVSILRKFEGLRTTYDRSARALEKFLEAESVCKRTNENLSSREWILNRPFRSELLFRVQKEISTILGRCPELSELDFEFGPGASLSCKGSSVSTYHKLSTLPEITLSGWHKAKSYIMSNRHLLDAFWVDADIAGAFSILGRPQIRIVNWNRLSFVPKTAKTDRAICVEPTLNSFFQKGIGNYIRNRLRLFGLPIEKQQSINARFAKQGSIYGDFATIDLSAASDTISAGLVSQLLDGEWFDLLDSFRCFNTLLPDGEILVNEKFSSMGNGFTFELETLIFYALVRVIRRINNIEKEVMTYGDDIIVPTEIADETILALQEFGFTINPEKTFTTGPFRESCGKDYFSGQNVRPYFAKRNGDHFTDYYSLANGIRHAAFRSMSETDFCDPSYRRAWISVIGQIPRKFRCFGPSWLGDQVLWCSRREHLSYQRSEYLFHTVRLSGPKSDTSRFRSGVILCGAALGEASRFALRGRVTSLEVTPFSKSFWSWWDGSWLDG